MAEQTQEQVKIPSKTFMEKAVKLAEEISAEWKFSEYMFNHLERFSELRFSYIKHYSEYSVSDRRDISGLLEQVDRFYDNKMNLARSAEFRRLLDAKRLQDARK